MFDRSSPTTETAPIPNSRLRSIDLMRGLGALAVLLFHVAPNAPAEAKIPSLALKLFTTAAGYGHQGVALFFVVSGFCIHLRWVRQYAATKRDEVDVRSFWGRRLLRLYPPYVVALCLTMLPAFWALRHGAAWGYPQPSAPWVVGDLLAHLTMLHGLHPVFDQGGGNPVYWTLAREEYLYVMYFVLLALRRRAGVLAVLPFSLACGLLLPLVCGLFLPTHSDWWRVVNTSAVVLWVQWCLGMVAVEWRYGLVKLPGWCANLWLTPLWLAAAVCLTHVPPAFSALLWGMAFFTLLNGCIRLEIAGKWVEKAPTRALVGVGLFSYSLYLVHAPALRLLYQTLGRRVMLLALPPGAHFTILAALFIVGGLAGGWLYFQLVERHFLTPGGERKSEGQSPASQRLLRKKLPS